MVPRFAGAALGLFAFFVATVAGLFAENPVEVVLSRSILALFLFCLLGVCLGTVAQKVVTEYEKGKLAEVGKRLNEVAAVSADEPTAEAPAETRSEPEAA